ncbi:TetR/AcrR family transcriptional regulator [Nocardia sp. NPDC005978]|uniref:TetR/AcrR family transcriptional regulator n=1 Tax=unclassified Nocardia TaxID=2637762 RepID=UPI0033B44271
MGRPPQRELPLRRRREIVEAAYEVFTAQGYEATAISEVAARAGIGQGTVYRYFGSKREILDHVIDFGVEKVMQSVRPETLFGVAESVGELVTVVRGAVERVYELYELEPQLVRLLLVEAGAIDEELAQRIYGFEGFVAALVTGELQRGMSAGWIRADIDAEVLSHTILTLVGPGLIRELHGSSTPFTRERSTAGLLYMLEKVLRVRKAAS